MKYYVEIAGPMTLDEQWTDPNSPYMLFTYNERDAQECIFDSQGRLFASYDTFEVPEGETFTYKVLPLNSPLETIVLQPGEYGVRPVDLEQLNPSVSQLI